MSQTAVPTTFTSATWAGTAASLGDASDATYVTSPQAPEPAQTFLCSLGPLTDPGVDTSHQIVVRAIISPPGDEFLDLILTLENTDDGSVVATKSLLGVPNSFQDVVLTLTAGEAALIRNYAGLRIRGYGQISQEIFFVWDAVPGADFYVFQIGTTDGGSDECDVMLEGVLTYSWQLRHGTHYARVAGIVGGVTQPFAKQTVTV